MGQAPDHHHLTWLNTPNLHLPPQPLTSHSRTPYPQLSSHPFADPQVPPPLALTEVLKGLLNLLGRQVGRHLRGHQGYVQPVIVVIAEYRVCPQCVAGQLLPQQADDLHLGDIAAVTQVWRHKGEPKSVRVQLRGKAGIGGGAAFEGFWVRTEGHQQSCGGEAQFWDGRELQGRILAVEPGESPGLTQKGAAGLGGSGSRF